MSNLVRHWVAIAAISANEASAWLAKKRNEIIFNDSGIMKTLEGMNSR